jgi:fumarate reductase subunit D
MSLLLRSRARGHTAYIAFLVHRISGLMLGLFIPVHLWTLGRAVNELDAFLLWSDQPLVKFAETGLVLALALHLGGGIRLMMLEFLSWRDWHKSLAAAALATGVAVTLLFALRLT